MKIEDAFSSKPRVKILKILFQFGQLNVSEIAHKLGVNYETALGHLKILERENILQHKMFGRTRLFRFDENSPKTWAVQKLLETWENTNERNLENEKRE